MSTEVIGGIIVAIIIVVVLIINSIRNDREEKLKQENNCRNALMLFPKTLENVTNIINKYYPAKNLVSLKFEAAIFLLYALDEFSGVHPKWFHDSIIAYISDNIKHFTKEKYEQKWKLYKDNSTDLVKYDYDSYKKYDTLFSLIKDNINDEIEQKLFKNKNNQYREAYLPIDSISEEIWKLKHIID
jgi:hypothetical protein